MTRTLVRKSHQHYVKQTVRGIGRAVWHSLEVYGWAISVGYGAVTPPPWEHHDQPGATL
jgi:hypothetical protein